MKRKTSLALLLCVLSAMVLVGCEPKSDTTGGGAAGTTNAAPATPSTNAPAK